MNPADIDYLKAELQQAQQLGITTTVVRVTELQSLLGKLTHLNERPEQPVQVMGYCRPGEIRHFRKGAFNTIRVRRKTDEFYKEPVYFDPPHLYGPRTEQ